MEMVLLLMVVVVEITETLVEVEVLMLEAEHTLDTVCLIPLLLHFGI
jgi:hypothetical protein